MRLTNTQTPHTAPVGADHRILFPPAPRYLVRTLPPRTTAAPTRPMALRLRVGKTDSCQRLVVPTHDAPHEPSRWERPSLRNPTRALSPPLTSMINSVMIDCGLWVRSAAVRASTTHDAGPPPQTRIVGVRDGPPVTHRHPGWRVGVARVQVRSLVCFPSAHPTRNSPPKPPLRDVVLEQGEGV